MTRVFVYGTLMDPDIRQAVLGADVSMTKATLKGHKAVFVLGEVFPKVLEDERFNLNGGVIEVDEDHLAQIDKFEGVEEGDYEKSEITVEVEGSETEATVYLGVNMEKTSRRWSLAEWEKLYKKSYLEKVERYMSGEDPEW